MDTSAIRTSGVTYSTASRFQRQTVVAVGLGLTAGLLPLGAASADESQADDAVANVFVEAGLTEDEAIDNSVLPEDLSDGFNIGEITVSFDFAADNNPRRDDLVESVADYGVTEDGHRILAQGQENGVRFYTVVDETTPTDANGVAEFEFDLDLDANAIITTNQDGSIAIITDNGATMIEPAIAFDANATPVDAAYSIENDQLILTVDTTGAVFPIIADPGIWDCWGVAKGIGKPTPWGLISAARKQSGCAGFLSWGICRMSHNRWFGGWARTVVYAMTAGRYTRC